MNARAPHAVQQPRFYVMNPAGDDWIQVSECFTSRADAQQAFERLRKRYPFARLGGSRRYAE